MLSEPKKQELREFLQERLSNAQETFDLAVKETAVTPPCKCLLSEIFQDKQKSELAFAGKIIGLIWAIYGDLPAGEAERIVLTLMAHCGGAYAIANDDVLNAETVEPKLENEIYR